MFIRHLVFSSVFLAAGLGVAVAQSSAVAAKPSATDKIPYTGTTYLQPQPRDFDFQLSPLPSSAPPEASCYTLRTYQFAPRDPSSDSLILKSETSCQSAGLFQLKDIMALPPKAPR